MDAVKFIEEKARMCTSNVTCAPCSIYKTGGDGFCSQWIDKHPVEAVAIVAHWSKEHPQKTILDDFLEKYPGAETYEEGIPISCAKHLGYTGQCNRICSECWNRPLSEVE